MIRKLYIILFLFIINVTFSQQNDFDFQSNFVYYDITELKDGMKFIIPDEHVLNFYFGEYNKKGNNKTIDINNLKDSIFTFKRYEERPYILYGKVLKDKPKVIAFIFERNGKEYQYLPNKTMEELKKKQTPSYSGEKYIKENIQDFVFYDDVEIARNLLIDKSFYLIRNYLDQKVSKLCKIINVEVNNEDLPIKITYLDEKGIKGNCKIRLSRTNERFNNDLDENYFKHYFITIEKYNQIQDEIKLNVEKDLKRKEEILKEQEEYEISTENQRFEDLKKDCHFEENGIDEFTNVKRVSTISFNIDNPKKIDFGGGELYFQLIKLGSNKYLRIHSSYDLGCTSSYDNNKSYVKIKLENNTILTFYHIGDIDCGKFELFANLSNSDIEILKKSQIKTVRLSGTEYIQDIKKIEWSSFFIDKLSCIK